MLADDWLRCGCGKLSSFGGATGVSAGPSGAIAHQICKKPEKASQKANLRFYSSDVICGSNWGSLYFVISGIMDGNCLCLHFSRIHLSLVVSH